MSFNRDCHYVTAYVSLEGRVLGRALDQFVGAPYDWLRVESSWPATMWTSGQAKGAEYRPHVAPMLWSLVTDRTLAPI
jgi:hypothetical protein